LIEWKFIFFIYFNCQICSWGEFAFVLATTAVQLDVIDHSTFSSIVLAVMLSILINPFLLRLTLARYKREAEKQIETAKTEAESKDAMAQFPVYFCIQTLSDAMWGGQDRLVSLLQDEGFDIIDVRTHHPRHDTHVKVSKLPFNVKGLVILCRWFAKKISVIFF
jgi:hypothetical protein